MYEKDLEHVYLCLAADGVSQTDARRYALYVLNAIVGGSMSSHLFQEIREKRGLVYNIFSYVNCYNDVGNFGIATSSSPECMEEVIALIRDETANLKKQGITAGELAFSKEHIKGNFFISLEGSEARMGRLAKNEIYFDRYVPVKQTLKQIDGVHAPQVHEMSSLVFGDEGTHGPRRAREGRPGRDRETMEELTVFVTKQAECVLPAYATQASSGMDLRAHLDKPLELKPLERALIPTGLAIALPAGYEAEIRPRSGLAAEFGITVLNAPGTIDADYRGEIKVILINLGAAPCEIKDGDRIAQMVFKETVRIAWREVEQLPESPRGEGGFGSTGRR